MFRFLNEKGFIVTLSAGDKAPNFKLPDQNEKLVKLSDFKGQWLLIYFYPKDNTPGCTKEACAVQDNLSRFNKLKLAVVGVSPDSAAKHQSFAGKFNLKFPLLADTEKEMCQAYGVWGKKKFMGREYLGVNRVSFLIDPKGKIAKVYPKVKPAEHAEEVLADFQEFTK